MKDVIGSCEGEEKYSEKLVKSGEEAGNFMQGPRNEVVPEFPFEMDSSSKGKDGFSCEKKERHVHAQEEE
jgi:viroplasmin and RNaseH domain-containing protein